MNFEKEYQDACDKDTDIHEHLPTISVLTSECNHVTELGVGWAQSTRAFLRHDVNPLLLCRLSTNCHSG